MLVFRLALLVLLLGRTVGTEDGRPRVLGSLQPILATSGDDVVLPCHLEPPESLEEAVVEWSRQDPTRVQYVHVYRDHGELTDLETASYRGRTALFPEELKRGNVSLKISGVSPADAGSYRCFVPTLAGPGKDGAVRLIVEPNLRSSTAFPRVPPPVGPDGPATGGGGAAPLALAVPVVLVLVLVLVLAAGAVSWKFCQRTTGSTPACRPAGSAGAPRGGVRAGRNLWLCNQDHKELTEAAAAPHFHPSLHFPPLVGRQAAGAAA